MQLCARPRGRTAEGGPGIFRSTFPSPWTLRRAFSSLRSGGWVLPSATVQTEPRWQPLAVLLLGFRLGICLSVGMLAIAVVQKQDLRMSLPAQRFLTFALSTLAFQGGAIALTHFFLREQRWPWQSFLGVRSWADAGRNIGIGVAAGALAIPGIFLLNEISVILLTLLQGAPEVQTTVQIIRLTVSSWYRLGFAVAAIVLAPVGEEILFRGLLYRTIRDSGWPRAALILSSVTFGFIHFNPMALVPLSYFALLLALLYEKSGSLLAPMAAHASFNAFNFLALMSPQS